MKKVFALLLLAMTASCNRTNTWTSTFDDTTVIGTEHAVIIDNKDNLVVVSDTSVFAQGGWRYFQTTRVYPKNK